MSNLGLLRDIAEDELGLMRSWRNHPAIRANMYTQHEIGVPEHLTWWEKMKSRADQKYFMFELDGSPSGIAAFSGIDTKNGNSAWSFYASPTAPRGCGSKMEYLMLEYAFGVLGLHKLYCEVLAYNIPVINLHKNFSFQVEGVFRAHFRSENGWVDICRLGILSSEWQAHRQQMLEKITHRESK
jgi:UDP-4-amino-4,6-dideoxy-N-acetyl-beta-L-altrosamine N-acetyltransferase